jgi:hypothetical protein
MTFNFENLFESKVVNDSYNVALTKRCKEKIVNLLLLVYEDSYTEIGAVFNNFFSRISLANFSDGSGV